jgi:MSHA pilin protein MshA
LFVEDEKLEDRPMKTEAQKGFTLIELVVVIALLGILAAFAIPRFASLESEARSAVTQGLSGSVRSAAAMAHGLHLATGAASVDMEGNTIAIVNGYPSAATIIDTLADATGFDAPVVAAGTATIAKTGAPGACEVVYTEPAAAGSPPSVVVDVSGC